MSEGEIVLLIPLVAVSLPIVLVPTILTLRANHRKREWDHMERMKAIELGQPVPAPTGTGGAIAIGTVVPMLSVLGALAVTFSSPRNEPYELQISAVAWGCATLISFAALLSALILGLARSRLQNKLTMSAHAAGFDAKPSPGPEAYEFAGHRN